MLGLSYAAVPLYALFCQLTGYGGTVGEGESSEVKRALARAKEDPSAARPLRIEFNADVSANLPWTFEPSQRYVHTLTGDSVLAFYRATNTLDRPVIGISTYNVTPAKVAPYFVKVQCFCFDEQRLRAGETVEMPVLFYIDPDMLTDPACADVTSITLSYTFFLVDEQAFYDAPENQPV